MFCVRGFGGGLGFLSFLGGCSGLSVVFSRASGVSWFLACSAPCVGVGGGLWGVPGVRGWCARVVCSSLIVGGRAGGCACARLSVLLPPCWGGGFGCACCPVPVVGVGLCPVSCSCSRCCCRVRGGFSGVVFSVRCFSCLLVLRCLVLCWVVVSAGLGGCGGCRVGFGVVFSPAFVVLARACFRFPFVGGWFGFGLGFVWRV